MKFCMLCWIWR